MINLLENNNFDQWYQKEVTEYLSRLEKENKLEWIVKPNGEQVSICTEDEARVCLSLSKKYIIPEEFKKVFFEFLLKPIKQLESELSRDVANIISCYCANEIIIKKPRGYSLKLSFDPDRIKNEMDWDQHRICELNGAELGDLGGYCRCNICKKDINENYKTNFCAFKISTNNNE